MLSKLLAVPALCGAIAVAVPAASAAPVVRVLGNSTAISPDIGIFGGTIGTATFFGENVINANDITQYSYDLVNEGDGQLNFTGPATLDQQQPNFTISQESIDSPGGDIRRVTLTYNPVQLDFASAEVSIPTNDPELPIFKFIVRGFGISAAPTAEADIDVRINKLPVVSTLKGGTRQLKIKMRLANLGNVSPSAVFGSVYTTSKGYLDETAESIGAFGIEPDRVEVGPGKKPKYRKVIIRTEVDTPLENLYIGIFPADSSREHNALNNVTVIPVKVKK